MSVRFALATLVAGLLIAALIVAADYALLPPVNEIMPAGDKVAHFVLMGGLALLANLAWRNQAFRVGGLRLMAGSVVVGVLITIEEISQHWLPHRTFSWADLAANGLGVLAASLLADYLIRRGRALRRQMALARRSLTTSRG